ncbi:hydroxymethylpyrimidine/phosphomethylpyrimidine kinase [Streptomyces sp. NPDC090493]|uniref:bifunctional hydroxymethylpyrimidine kinase/phosphomethylpyrimidine kinase n=1 Tax=Streptomyces sp. NPDC090493 TaxID=3365964 RepID=UPI003807739B
MNPTPLASDRPPATTVRTRCVTIGSSDSGGGAGIQGDLKAFASVGAYGASVLVGVTAQNTTGVSARAPIDPELVDSQLKAVLDDIGADGLKVGTTWSPLLVWTLAERLGRLTDAPVVVDPVMVTAAGSALGGDAESLAAVREGLLPLARTVTPNLTEARLLTGLGQDAPLALLAEKLIGLGAASALITDAFPDGPDACDWLFDGEEHHEIRGPRENTRCDHGAGCAHSALLTVFLARGTGLLEAARQAHEAVRLGIRHGAADIGSGRHPVDLLSVRTAR